MQGYDYSNQGAYFLTICVNHWRLLLSEIKNELVILNNAGEMIQKYWYKLPSKFPNIELDQFVIMPNHFHCILFIVGADPCVRPRNEEGTHKGVPLPTVIQWFKTMTTNEYINGVKYLDWPSFERRLWQRNYYEHIIRNDDDLNATRQYILNNPINWAKDEFYVE